VGTPRLIYPTIGGGERKGPDGILGSTWGTGKYKPFRCVWVRSKPCFVIKKGGDGVLQENGTLMRGKAMGTKSGKEGSVLVESKTKIPLRVGGRPLQFRMQKSKTRKGQVTPFLLSKPNSMKRRSNDIRGRSPRKRGDLLQEKKGNAVRRVPKVMG